METFLKENVVMLEYGSGKSTLWFSQFVRKYYSIEHDLEWGKTLQDALKTNQYGNVEYLMVPVPAGHKGWKGDLST